MKIHITNVQSGMTLIELVISIVIISVSLTGVLIVMNRTAVSSADPMIRTQATAIAQSYLEEIMLQKYSDPDQVETGAAEAGETRDTYDDVADYHNLASNGCITVTASCPLGTCACDQNGTPIDLLRNYSIQINVVTENMDFAGLTSVTARRIDVTVTHGTGIKTTLTSYRADL